MHHHFTLTYRLPPEAPDSDELLKRLARYECTDALVGLGTPGVLGLEFRRKAPSFAAALRSAFEAVRLAVPGITLVEARPGPRTSRA